MILTSDFKRSVLKFGTEIGEIFVSDPLLLFAAVGVVADGEDTSPDTLTSRSRLSNSCDDLWKRRLNSPAPMRHEALQYLALLVFLTEHGLPSLAIVVLSDSVESLLNME